MKIKYLAMALLMSQLFLSAMHSDLEGGKSARELNTLYVSKLRYVDALRKLDGQVFVDTVHTTMTLHPDVTAGMATLNKKYKALLDNIALLESALTAKGIDIPCELDYASPARASQGGVATLQLSPQPRVPGAEERTFASGRQQQAGEVPAAAAGDVATVDPARNLAVAFTSAGAASTAAKADDHADDLGAAAGVLAADAVPDTVGALTAAKPGVATGDAATKNDRPKYWVYEKSTGALKALFGKLQEAKDYVRAHPGVVASVVVGAAAGFYAGRVSGK